jgi:hypothetical protein
VYGFDWLLLCALYSECMKGTHDRVSLLSACFISRTIYLYEGWSHGTTPTFVGRIRFWFMWVQQAYNSGYTSFSDLTHTSPFKTTVHNRPYKVQILLKHRLTNYSQDSYGLSDRGVGVRVLVVVRIFTSPCRPDRLRGPPSLLSNG